MSVYRRKSGRWAVRIDIDRSADGRRATGARNVCNAERGGARRADALQSRDRGIVLHPDRIDVAALLDRYVCDRAALGRGARTVERYEELVRLYLKPHVGSIALSKLKPAHVTELVTRLSEQGGVKGRPLSAKSVSHALPYCASTWMGTAPRIGRTQRRGRRRDAIDPSRSRDCAHG